MQKIGYILLGFLLMVGGFPQSVLSKTLTLVNLHGESTDIEVGPQDNFLDVMECFHSYCHHSTLAAAECLDHEATLMSLPFDCEMSHAGITLRAKKHQDAQDEDFRNYNKPITKEDTENLRYIIKISAWGSDWEVARHGFDMNDAGKKLEHLHPLRFLMIIFTDEEMKAGIHKLRAAERIGGGYIWDRFLGGIKRGLTEETAKDNVKIEHIKDFAKKVGIDSALIIPSLQQHKWEKCVDILIDNIPRKNNPGRYNM
jgi:hypothetical protein